MKAGVLVILVALVAGCGSEHAVGSQELPQTQANLSYTVNNPVDANRAAQDAQYWCSTRYGFRARRIQTTQTPTGAVVRYACSPR